MKKIFNFSILFLMDVVTLMIAIYIAYILRQHCVCFENDVPEITLFSVYGLTYPIVLSSLIISGVYTKRYDFWQDTYHVIRSSILSTIIILAMLAIMQEAKQYSRFILIVTLMLFIFLAPLQKYLTKQFLFKIGSWKLPSQLLGEDLFFQEHVYSNRYLGYVACKTNKAQTLFVSSSLGSERLEEIIYDALIEKQEVIFIPLVKNFDFSDARIIHLYNARTNLIVVENNLMDKVNLSIKWIVDYTFALILLPFMLIAIGIISIAIKLDDGSPIFFSQKRIGRHASEFYCFKFRTMKMDADELLKHYLEAHPEEKAYYNIYHKYQNDPRVTKIGKFLRKTSLDELPQILNVLKGEMSLIGPRPYMPSEKVKIGQNIDLILAVKPGITGLWQVSGRNEIDFKSRIDMDVWYVRNWNIWRDIVILIKTVQVVLARRGAI
ncbi:exopolysaccharide biosynthesis polyprenyl glycosylphosphotransferase [Sulfurospirillum oryzae]|uniref:exopolysaccharide biosynthesis polyprenyl glycosylphosphotransferase n=1 Tax=Sulfurospirillum oryzae TaxID=2976535 RepID=UPI0021E975BB|nr:exopolysaccharide biosynthesis polyprenyl glycosylphosphotransferase [Sulfurospirillum oryzae]